METPIDLTAERNKRAAPDPEFVTTDQYGRKMYAFSIDYPMGKNMFTFNVWAYDWPDAEARLASIKAEGVISGQLMEVVPY